MCMYAYVYIYECIDLCVCIYAYVYICVYAYVYMCVYIFFILSLFFQERFTHDMQPHYIYSPREMSRWVRGICEALRPLESLPVEGLVRIWAHEALRLFHDRYVSDHEPTRLFLLNIIFLIYVVQRFIYR